jgi:hypothetical protein
VRRRRRCWNILQELDPEIELSEGHCADLLLDPAGIDENGRIMTQASISNARDFEKVADALIAQHPHAHVRVPSEGKGKGLRLALLGGNRVAKAFIVALTWPTTTTTSTTATSRMNQ